MEVFPACIVYTPSDKDVPTIFRLGIRVLEEILNYSWTSCRDSFSADRWRGINKFGLLPKQISFGTTVFRITEFANFFVRIGKLHQTLS